MLAIFGEKTFPIATNEAGDVVIAGAEYGKVIDCYRKREIKKTRKCNLNNRVLDYFISKQMHVC